MILQLYILPFKCPLCLCQLQDLTKFELAKMPSCNLAKSVYNKWLQQSSNQGTNLYVATVDDFVWVLMQVVRYYHYLKDEHTSIHPRKEELLLRVVQCSIKQTRDPKVLNVAMAKLHGVDLFCTCEPHLVGKEILGSQKHKANVPLGFEGKSH